MFDNEDDLIGNIIYCPCKNCGSVNYDMGDCDEPEFTDDGKVKFQPKTCDICDLNQMLSESNSLH